MGPLDVECGSDVANWGDPELRIIPWDAERGSRSAPKSIRMGLMGLKGHSEASQRDRESGKDLSLRPAQWWLTLWPPLQLQRNAFIDGHHEATEPLMRWKKRAAGRGRSFASGPGGMKVRGKTLLIFLIYLSIHKGRRWWNMVAHLQSQHLEMGIRRTVHPKLPWEHIADSRPPLRLCLQTKQSKNIMSKVKQWDTQINSLVPRFHIIP